MRTPLRLGLACVAVLGLVAPLAPASHASAAAWSAAIEPLAHRVEQLRGLKFEHPVPVVVLDDAAYRKRVDPGEFTSEQRAALALAGARWSAVGLIAHGADLAHSLTTFVGIDSAAVYDPRTQRVYVHGRLPAVLERVILSHELTHALDDQHFGLRKVERTAAVHGGSLEARAVIEGDAERVRIRYLASLSAADRLRYRAASAPRSAQADAELASEGTPDGLIAYFLSPYALGTPMIDTVTGGRLAKVDHLFRHPPRHEVAMLAPATLIDGSRFRQIVDLDDLDGDLIGRPSALGALSLYLVLGEHVPLQNALAAADGWGGDSMRTVRRGGAVCVHDRIVGRTRADTERIGAALDTWALAMPPANVDVTGADSAVVLDACDRVADPALAARRVSPVRSLTFAADRNLLVGSLVGRGAKLAVAVCAANRAVEQPSTTALLDEQQQHHLLDPTTHAFEQLRRRALASRAACATGGSRGVTGRRDERPLTSNAP